MDVHAHFLGDGLTMARNFVGIDIRTHGVAVVAASGTRKEIRLEAARYVKRTPETDLSSALSLAMEAISVSGAVVVVSVPGEAVSFRHLSIPFNSPKKIRMVLPSELEPLLPFPLDSVRIDSTLVSTDPGDGTTRIIAAALEKSVLDGYLERLAGCGIFPDLVVPGGWATARVAATGAEASGTWMLVDASAAEGVVACGVGLRIYSIRGFRVPDGDGDVSARIFSEAHRAVLGFSERLGVNLWPEIVWVTGTWVDDRKLPDTPFHVPVAPLNLAHSVGTGVRVGPEAGWDPMIMNGALALVLGRLRSDIGLTFHERGIGLGALFAEHGQSLWRLAAVGSVVAVLGFFNLWYESHALEQKLARLDLAVKAVFTQTFPDVQRIVDPLQQMKVKIREIQEASGLEAEGAADVRVIDILEIISREIPDTIDIEMTQMNFSGDTVLFSGDTGNFNSVDEIKTILEKNPAFSAVTITSANMEKSGEKVQFKLTANLAPGP